MSNKKTPLVSIIMGSQSDWESVKPASKILITPFNFLFVNKCIMSKIITHNIDAF